METTHTFLCLHCGRSQEVKVSSNQSVKYGEVIYKYPGGNNWGVCVFCHKSGLKNTTRVTKKKERPVGWTKVPEK